MTTRKSRLFMKWILPAVALVSLLIGLGGALPAAAQAGILDHVAVTPASVSLAVGATQQFAAQGYDVANNPISGLTYLWNVASGGGTISASGLFTAGGTPGAFNNTVQAFAVQGSAIKYGSASVVVTAAAPGPLDHVTVSPSTATLAAGTTQQFTVQAYDAANTPITGLSILWSIVNGGGSVSAAGLFTAGSTTGTFLNTVQAVAVQGTIIKIGTASVTVTAAAAAGPLDHVVVSPSTANVAVGGTQQFTAQAFDAASVPIAGLTFTWNTIAGGGTISSTGLFTAGGVAGSFPNTVQAVATQGSITKSGTASVSVTATPVPPVPGTQLDAKGLLRLITASVDALNFDNFLGAQLSATVGGQPVTVKAIPGVINALSGTSLTLQPNGQTATQVFTLPGEAGVLGNNAALKVGDKVVVVTVNDTVRLVVPVPIHGSSSLGDENNGKGSDDKDENEHEGRALGHTSSAITDSVKAPQGNALGRFFNTIQAPGKALGHLISREHNKGHSAEADD